jgi:hypothetical protein
MNKNLKTLASALTLVFFLFIAYGSNDEKSTSTTNDIEEKSEVSNLTQAQKDSAESVSKENKEKAENALKNFKKNKDDFQGDTFYSDPRTPTYTNTNFIYPYIGNKGDQYWLRLKFQYTSQDWLFINNTILMVDDEKFNISGSWERDHDSRIWEWLDIAVQEREYQMLKKIANSKTTKVRYEGNKYHDDRALTQEEKDIIKKTLEIYDGVK